MAVKHKKVIGPGCSVNVTECCVFASLALICRPNTCVLSTMSFQQILVKKTKGENSIKRLLYLFSGNCLTLVVLMTSFRRKAFHSLILVLHLGDYCYLHISVFVRSLIYTYGIVLFSLVSLNPNCLIGHTVCRYHQ